MDDNPGRNLTAEDFDSTRSFFSKLGAELGDIVYGINSFVAQNDSADVAATAQLYEKTLVFTYILIVIESFFYSEILQ